MDRLRSTVLLAVTFAGGLCRQPNTVVAGADRPTSRLAATTHAPLLPQGKHDAVWPLAQCFRDPHTTIYTTGPLNRRQTVRGNRNSIILCTIYLRGYTRSKYYYFEYSFSICSRLFFFTLSCSSNNLAIRKIYTKYEV